MKVVNHPLSWEIYGREGKIRIQPPCTEVKKKRGHDRKRSTFNPFPFSLSTSLHPKTIVRDREKIS